MNQGPPDNFESPLDEVLRNVPEEQPPPGLKDRCLSALHQAQREQRLVQKLNWSAAWKGLLAAAGTVALLLIVVFGSMRPKYAHMSSESAKMAMESNAKMAAPAMKGGTPMSADHRQVAMAPRAPSATSPAYQPAAKAKAESAGQPVQFKREEAPPGQPGAAPAGAAATMPPPAADEGNSWNAEPAAPAKPWRDYSTGRQKITRKEMALEVKDVEDAYDDACRIIEKAGGYVDTEDLRVEERGPDRARLMARIPVDRFDGAVSQLRELGKVVRMTGESEDKTKEYQGRGESIRGLGAKEEELVAKYEAERNRYRKQQLYEQIMALRANNAGQKSALSELSDQTHFAYLELTLSEKGGPGEFLSRTLRNSGSAAAWVGATAIFWVPALVIGFLIYRRTKARQQP